jgi:long-chain acyl-CoA synthetase
VSTTTTDDPRIAALSQGMVVSHFAGLHPDEAAVIQGDRTVTFAQLNHRANQLVRALRARGVRPGDGIALMCANRVEFVEAYAAAERGGLRLTPVNWHLNGDEAGYIVDDCEAVAFVADARFAEAAAAAAAAAPGATVRLAVEGSIEGFEDYESAVAGEDGHDIDDPRLGTRMLYTSGTTGRPKGVFRPPASAAEAAVTAAAAATVSGYRADTGQLHLCTGPLYHAAPLLLSLAPSLNAGVGVVLMDAWDAAETLRLVDRHRITHSHMVPTMFHRLLSLPQEVRDAHDVSSLQFIIHGAAPCPVAVKAALIEWWGPIVFEYYAAIDGSGTTVTSTDWLRKPGTVGKPVTEDHIRILDDDGDDLPPNEAGTVYLKSPAVGRFAYFKDEEKTEGAYKGDWYTLGDVGYLDDDGWLFLTDRSAHLIISGGVNIYPAEVEAVLLTHPAVGDVGVIGVPNHEWGEEVKAIVEPQPGVEGTPELAAELLAYCRERLASFKCPRSVDFTAELPRHDNGKLYKQALRQAYREEAGGR